MNKDNFDISTSELYKRVNKQIGLDNGIENIIFVYCPPKVGSTSLVSSLRLSLNDTFHVKHIHDETMLKIVTGIENITIQGIINYNVFINKNVFVIDIYREPLERKMSEYFGKLSAYHFNTTNKKISSYSIERIVKRFNLIFPYIANEDHFYQRYDTHGINKIFDFEKKHTCVKQKDKLTYLKLRLRDAFIWPEILEPYLGKKIVMIRDYERNNLPLSELYNHFKKIYRIPENLLYVIKNDQSFQSYLSKDEQKDYLLNLTYRQTTPCKTMSTNEYSIYKEITDENQSMVDIETDHYFDEGCRCINCTKMRKYILIRIKNKQSVPTKLIHKEVKKYIQEHTVFQQSTYHTLPLNRFRR